MAMTEKDLLKLKEGIDDARTKLNEQKGRLSYLMQELERQWQCKSIDDAKVLLATMETQIKNLNAQILNGLLELEARLK